MNRIDCTMLPIENRFTRDDPRHPANLSRVRKALIVLAGLVFSFNSGLGSSLPSGAVDYLAVSLEVVQSTDLVLLNSLYLVGFAIGPLIFGPLSEHCGRRPVIIYTYIGLTLSTLVCALAPSFAVLLLARTVCGTQAAVANTVIAGLYADIYDDPDSRGSAMGVFMFVTALSPLFGPIISGFVSPIGWRWTFWIGLMLLAAGLPVILYLPETCVPVLAERHRQQDQTCQSGMTSTAKRTALILKFRSAVSRPFIMTAREPVLFATSMYLALVYSIMYLFFQAYPIIFSGLYGMSAAQASLAYIPIMLGICASFVMFLYYNAYHKASRASGAAWACTETYLRLPLACAGGPCIVVGLLWLGWASSRSTHPIVPMLCGFPFGIGYHFIFLAMINHLSDTFALYAASAQAAASTIRSIFAVCLPLAARPMYGRLGIGWASTTLALLALVMTAIPFIFLKLKWSSGRYVVDSTPRQIDS